MKKFLWGMAYLIVSLSYSAGYAMEGARGRQWCSKSSQSKRLKKQSKRRKRSVSQGCEKKSSQDLERNPKTLVDLSKNRIVQILTSLTIEPEELKFITNLLKNISSLGGLYKDMIYQALIEKNWPLLISAYKPNVNHKVLKGHKGTVLSVAISPDCRFVLTGSEDRTAILWDANSFEKVQMLQGHNDSVTSVAFSLDGKYIFTGSIDKTVIKWKWCTNNFEKVEVISGIEAPITSVALSPNDDFILLGLFGYNAILLNLDTHEKVELELKDSSFHSCLAAAFSSDGKYVLINSWDCYGIWDIVTLKRLIILKHENMCSSAFSPDGKHILTGSSHHEAILRDMQLNETGILNGHSGNVNSVSFNVDGKYALTGSFDKKAILWQINSLEKIAVLKGHARAIRAVAFSSDNQFVVTGSEDNTAIVWSLRLPELSIESLVRSIIINKLSKLKE